MKKILKLFVFLGMLSINNSYSMLNSDIDKKASSDIKKKLSNIVIYIIKDFFYSSPHLLHESEENSENLSVDSENLVENFLKDTQLIKAIKEGIFFKDPLDWLIDN